MLRITLISKLIHILENLFFYPKLKKFYVGEISKHEPVILDVGANKGQTIDFFLNIFDKCTIYAFEPNKALFDHLTAKYKGKKNIYLFNFGVSDKNGTLTFNETVTHETSTFETINYDSDYLKMKSKVLGVAPENIIQRKYDVQVMNLSHFITQEKIKKVDVLKIDTEGHEYKCLLGLFGGGAANIDFIQLEQHNDDMYKDKVPSTQIDALLLSNGFANYKKIKHPFGDFEEVMYKKLKG